MKYKVDFINSSYRRFYKQNKKAIDKAVINCLAQGQFTLRKELWDFEKAFAKFVGAKYAAGVNSGTDALFLSLKALEIGEGDEVITVSNTFIATIQAIVHCGAKPVLVDVNHKELMDINQIRQAITPRTKAIIPVQYMGALCDMEAIKQIADEYNLFIVDDACQAVGAKGAGTFGILNCFSFNTAKLLGGLCDGGMVTTDDRALYEKICLLRNHWNVHQLSVDRNDYPQPEEMQWAWKSRLSNVNAAFLNIKLKKIKQLLKRREQIAKKYNKALQALPIVHLPFEQYGRVWQEYHLQLNDREKFADYLKNHGVETLTRDVVPNHKMKGLGLEHWNLPNTERLARQVTRLPLYPEMTDKEVDYVIKTVKSYYGK